MWEAWHYEGHSFVTWGVLPHLGCEALKLGVECLLDCEATIRKEIGIGNLLVVVEPSDDTWAGGEIIFVILHIYVIRDDAHHLFLLLPLFLSFLLPLLFPSPSPSLSFFDEEDKDKANFVCPNPNGIVTGIGITAGLLADTHINSASPPPNPPTHIANNLADANPDVEAGANTAMEEADELPIDVDMVHPVSFLFNNNNDMEEGGSGGGSCGGSCGGSKQISNTSV